MTANAAVSTSVRKVSFLRGVLAGVIAIAGSIVANLIVRWLGMLVLPVDPSFMPLATLQPTIFFTTVFLLLATVIFLIVNAFSKNPGRIFAIVATVALVISLVPDILLLVNPSALPLGTVTWGAVLILIVQHIVAYAITVWAFTRWAIRS